MVKQRTIVSVIGPHSGSGKTLLVAHLVRHIRGLGCLKISPAHDGQNQQTVNGARSELDFHLEDRTRLNQSGKDTALYLDAGAAHVEWLRHRQFGLAEGLHAALKRFPKAVPIIVESSSAVQLLDPAAVVMVVRPPIREVKPSTQAVLSRVNALLLNASGGNESGVVEAERLQADFPSLRPSHVWYADLIREEPPVEMLNWARGVLYDKGPAPEPQR